MERSHGRQDHGRRTLFSNDSRHGRLVGRSRALPADRKQNRRATRRLCPQDYRKPTGGNPWGPRENYDYPYFTHLEEKVFLTAGHSSVFTGWKQMVRWKKSRYRLMFPNSMTTQPVLSDAPGRYASEHRGREALIAVLAVCSLLLLPRSVSADDSLWRVTYTGSSNQRVVVEGKVLLEAQDGGILLLGRDGQLWTVTPAQLQNREQVGREFTPYTADELGEQLKAEVGETFEIVTTKHYVICTNAGHRYARWCAGLFERLLAGFQTHWRANDLKLHEPGFPLVAIIFADERQFADFAAKDAGANIASSKGYFSIRTNRMVLYDLTAGPNSRPAKSLAEITRKVAASPFNVATVVHEATHQIAFNSGLHTRYADNPLWLTEGMAMYFETPDLRSRTGWRTIGKPNALRFRQFQDYAAKRRGADSLLTLIQNNDRFQDPQLAADAYAEAWALSYFLIKTRRKAYADYLKRIAAKPPLIWDKPQQRLAEFQAAFGEDLGKLDRDFLLYITRLR